jgi:hypothetical protein
MDMRINKKSMIVITTLIVVPILFFAFLISTVSNKDSVLLSNTYANTCPPEYTWMGNDTPDNYCINNAWHTTMPLDCYKSGPCLEGSGWVTYVPPEDEGTPFCGVRPDGADELVIRNYQKQPQIIGPFTQSGKVVLYYKSLEGAGVRPIFTLKDPNGNTHEIKMPVLDGNHRARVVTDINVTAGQTITVEHANDDYAYPPDLSCAPSPYNVAPLHLAIGWINPVDNYCGTTFAGPPSEYIPFEPKNVASDITWAASSGRDVISKQCWGDWPEWYGDYDFNDYFLQISTERVNVDPTASLVVHPNSTKTSLGCFSTTHTGRLTTETVNEPIRMVARYTDLDGASDLEAMYVWLRVDTTPPVPNTPEYLGAMWSQMPRTYTNGSFGFMLRRIGVHTVFYVPSLVVESPKWVPAIDQYFNWFSVRGPNTGSMVWVRINEFRQDPTDSNSMILDFDLFFNSVQEANLVRSGEYNIFVMANDQAGFTPDEPDRIKNYLDWINSGKKWNVDINRPQVEYFTTSITGNTEITLNWNLTDLEEVDKIAVNAYISEGIASPSPISVKSINSTGNSTIAPAPFVLKPEGSGVTGHLDQDYLFKIDNVGGTNRVGSATIDVGNNHEGSIIFYITVFDKGCNVNQSYLSYDLQDWIITYGGLVYSSGGLGFVPKEVDNENAWTSTNLLNKITPSQGDITSELVGDRVVGLPSAPLKSSLHFKSYNIRGYTPLKEDKFYTELRDAFEKRKGGIPGLIEGGSPSVITGSLHPTNGAIKYYDVDGNLTVGGASPFICNGKGLILVSGNLTIQNHILNVNYNKDACIFVVKGNVNITEGNSVSGSSIAYDEINAYILADGIITIEPESSKPPTQKKDGMYISGGIQSASTQGLQLKRFLSLNDRATFPSVFVNHHSKYGVASHAFFGHQVDIVRTEVGYKPY